MKLVVFNLKMNLLSKDVDEYLNNIKNYDLSNVVFCPSAIYLERFKENNITIGSQDIGFALMGAYTGDISVLQLKELGCKYSIVGHSERREYYMDSRFVQKKIKLCLENEVTPILCIGETLEENSRDESYKICIDKIDKAFINNNHLDQVIISYEPIWAIGSGIIPTMDFIQEHVFKIKNYVYNKYGINISILYGGSINENNIQQLAKIDVLDGFLVGGCSLDVKAVRKIIEAVKGV